MLIFRWGPKIWSLKPKKVIFVYSKADSEKSLEGADHQGSFFTAQDLGPLVDRH